MPELPVTPELPISSVTGLVAAQSTFGLSKRTEGTISLLRTVVQESSATFWYEQGKAHAGQAEWQEAVYAFRQCTERDATHWQGWIQLAGGLAETDQPEQAAQALQQAFEYNNSGWDAFATELCLEKWQLLRTCLEQQKTIAVNKFTLFFGLTLVYHALEDFEQVHQVLELMKSLYEHYNEQLASWYQLYGNVYFEQDKWEASLAYYDHTIEQNPQHDAAYVVRGKAKYGLQDYVGAIADFDHAIKLNPKHWQTFNSRGDAKYDLQDYMGAINDYGLAIELNPHGHEIYINRYKAKKELHLSEATVDLDKAILLSDGKYTWFYLNKIQDVFYSNSNEALSILNKIIELAPTNYYAYSIRGKFYISLSLYDLAIIDYSYIIEINPYSKAFAERARANFLNNNYQQAINDYNQAILLDPSNSELLLKRSEVKLAIGDSLGSKNDLIQAKKLGAVTQDDLNNYISEIIFNKE